MTADPHTIARWLVHERRVSVIPLDHPAATTQTDPSRVGKVPLGKWAAFQRTPPSDENLQAWFGNGTPRNLGIVTGTVSRLVAIDLDSPEAIAWADAHLPPTPMITTTATGEHRFFQHPGGTVRNKVRLRTGDLAVKIDVRADGGYCVAPGSLHASGRVYARRGDWPPIDALPVFDPTWIEEAPAAEPEARQASSARQTTHTTANDRDRLLHRARRYLDATPPAIEGHGGDTHTFQVCCRLVRGFDIAEVDALDLLREWNARCVPPWSEYELVEKIDGARKYGDEPIGARADEARHTRTTSERRSTGAGDTRAATVDASRPPAEPAGIHNLTDSGNGEYLAACYGHDVRRDHKRERWLLWRGHRFQPDADAEIRRLAKTAMRQRFRDAAALDDPDARSRLAKWALSSESRARLDALLALAQAEHPIADAGDGWDADPWILGVPNGVVDLRTGRLRAGRRDDRITMNAAVAYDPAAPCARWERSIAEIFADKTALMRFVQRAIGYSLTGLTTEQVLFLCYGTGANGKGTFTNTIKWVVGDYGWNMPFATVEMRDRAAIPNDLAALVGRRFVVASETNDGTRLNESRVKALTGCDPITARFLHAEFFTFEPVAKFWLSVNHKPIVRDDSHGFWRRIRLIPFTQTFPVNPTLADDIRAEAAGILAWAVRGCLQWQYEGLNPPAEVLDATNEYERDSDPLGGFLDEACERDTAAESAASELYDTYKRWAERHGLSDRERLTATMFGRKMSERFEKRKRGTLNVYLGLSRRLEW
jgi:putative DNA primase/helicase